MGQTFGQSIRDPIPRMKWRASLPHFDFVMKLLDKFHAGKTLLNTELMDSWTSLRAGDRTGVEIISVHVCGRREGWGRWTMHSHGWWDGSMGICFPFTDSGLPCIDFNPPWIDGFPSHRSYNRRTFIGESQWSPAALRYQFILWFIPTAETDLRPGVHCSVTVPLQISE